MITPAMWLGAACVVLGLLVGKRSPIIAGGLFVVALYAVLWAPGGLV